MGQGSTKLPLPRLKRFGPMPVIYTAYAEETLKVREISKDEVEFALLNPEETKEPPVIDGWDYMGGSETALLSLRIGCCRCCLVLRINKIA